MQSAVEDRVGQRKGIECEKNAFQHYIEEHRSDLLRYCRKLAYSAWDADDLWQTTWLKAFRAWQKSRCRISKPFLWRIAYHTWVDHKRKKTVALDEWAQADDVPDVPDSCGLEVELALQLLVRNLTIKQQTVFLLVDVLHCTAQEVADLTLLTESAVKGVLYRARQKIRHLAKQHDMHEHHHGQHPRKERKGRKTREKDTGSKRQASYTRDEAVLVSLYRKAIEKQDWQSLALLANGESTDVQMVRARQLAVSYALDKQTPFGEHGLYDEHDGNVHSEEHNLFEERHPRHQTAYSACAA
jgi:RNA polymerase sigma factor (sigma-70 family)